MPHDTLGAPKSLSSMGGARACVEHRKEEIILCDFHLFDTHHDLFKPCLATTFGPHK